MAVDLSKMSDKELAKLQTDIVKETQRRAKSKIEDARKAAEAAAKKHGFSLNELVGSKPARGGAKRAASAPKYKNPDDPSQTWSGRGRQPAWYKSAIESGKTPESMAI